MALLEVRDLETAFETPDGFVPAVAGVSFTIEPGETLGLVGESGSGKSVTALSILRLVPPAKAKCSGSIVLDGLDLLTASDRVIRTVRGGRIAMIFQDPMTSLNPVLPIGRQITETIRAHRQLSRGAARTRALELLASVGIPDPERRFGEYPHQFSGGMRQRVMIAIALSCQPELIIADEITTALDVTIQAQVLDLLRRLVAEHRTAMILITHDLGVVAGMTDRVHVMYAGEIVEKATTSELFAEPRMPYTWGLLRSLPRLDDDTETPLEPIEGAPPELSTLPIGCRFEPRCRYRREICHAAAPTISQATGASLGHEVRCWGTQDVAGGGWLRNVDWRSNEREARAMASIPGLDRGGPSAEGRRTQP